MFKIIFYLFYVVNFVFRSENILDLTFENYYKTIEEYPFLLISYFDEENSIERNIFEQIKNNILDKINNQIIPSRNLAFAEVISNEAIIKLENLKKFPVVLLFNHGIRIDYIGKYDLISITEWFLNFYKLKSTEIRFFL